MPLLLLGIAGAGAAWWFSDSAGQAAGTAAGTGIGNAAVIVGIAVGVGVVIYAIHVSGKAK